MSLIPPETFRPADAPEQAPFTPGTVGRGLRVEDGLRLLAAGILVLLGGLGLGSFTFHEVAVRGTGYFVVLLALAVVLTAVAYYKFDLCLALFIGVIWIDLGQTPDLATGQSSGTGKALYPVELAALFLLFVWAVRRFSGRGGGLLWTPMNKPLVLYLAFSLWTAVNGYLFWDPALTHFYAGLPGEGHTPPLVIALELTLRVLSIGTFWLLASTLVSPQWLRRASYLLALPGLLLALSFWHLLPFVRANNWSVMLETGLACGLWAWLLENPAAPRPRRLAAGAGIFVLILQVFLLSITWISGWLSLFAGLLFIAHLKARRLFWGLIAGAAALAVCAAPFLQEKVVHKVQVSGDMDRLSLMRGALLYALHYPLGVGPGNYRAYNMYYGSKAMWNTSGYTSAHNFYAQSLSEMGFIGLIFTLIWVVTGVVMLTRFYRRMQPGFSRTTVLMVGGLWAGVAAASAVGDYFIPVYHNGGLGHLSTTIYAWIGLGIAVAHARREGVLTPEVPAPAAAPVPPRWQPDPRPYPRRMTR